MPISTAKFVKGSESLGSALRALTEGMRQEVLLEGMRELCKPIEVAAKRYAKRSEDTGALRASITIKTINYPKAGKAVGMVGPDKAARRGRNRAGRLGQYLHGTRRPAKYAHLIEYGHVIAVGGSLTPQYNVTLEATGKFSKSGRPIRRWKRTSVKAAAKGRAGGFVPAKPFIRPAVLTTTAQQEEGFYRGLERGWNRIVNREVSSGRHIRS